MQRSGPRQHQRPAPLRRAQTHAHTVVSKAVYRRPVLDCLTNIGFKACVVFVKHDNIAHSEVWQILARRERVVINCIVSDELDGCHCAVFVGHKAVYPHAVHDVACATTLLERGCPQRRESAILFYSIAHAVHDVLARHECEEPVEIVEFLFRRLVQRCQ